MSDPVKMTINGLRVGPPSRREAMQWVMAAVAAGSAPGIGFGQAAPKAPAKNVQQEDAAKLPDPSTLRGYGTDPNLLKVYNPGDLWPLTFSAEQKRIAAALADVVLPKDELGPAASEVGVVEMADEWISAPYPQQQADRKIVLEGLGWIDQESTHRFGKPFAEITAEQHRAICDDICFLDSAREQFKPAARFFSRFRSICAGAYFATPPGWEAIGYVGNVALPSFDGPTPEVLKQLGVKQTVRSED
jgi:hypothetical protein